MQEILNKVVEELILWYRSNISPIKGYQCAHNTLHGKGSCSDWALSVTQEKGALVMLLNLITKLYECNSSSITLNKNNNKFRSEERKGSRMWKIRCCGMLPKLNTMVVVNPKK